MNRKISPSFAFSHINREKKKLFTRRKILLSSEVFYFIWKVSFLQEHNNDLLIYKMLYFRSSQKTFLIIMISYVSNFSHTWLEHQYLSLKRL